MVLKHQWRIVMLPTRCVAVDNNKVWQPIKRKPPLIILDGKRLRQSSYYLIVGQPTLSLSWTVGDLAYAVELDTFKCGYNVTKSGRGVMLLSSKQPSDTLASLSDTGDIHE